MDAMIVYGSNDQIKRRLLWEELGRIHIMVGLRDWVVGGDFNAILMPIERQGAYSSTRRVQMTLGMQLWT